MNVETKKMMDIQPVLEGELVVIRPLKETDLEPLYSLAKDRLIWGQHPIRRYLRTEFEDFFAESIKSGGALIIKDKVTEKTIGSSRFKMIEGLRSGVEIGWTFLGREYWGGKYNGAVKELMIEHAFKYVETIVFYVAKENIRSQRAVEKINGRKISESEYPELRDKSRENVTYVIEKPRDTH